MTVTLTGRNFYSNADTQGPDRADPVLGERRLRVRLTREETVPSDEPLQHVVDPPLTSYDGDSSVDGEIFHTVSFTFPEGVFSDKDWVRVELTFDEITWTLALTSRLAMYRQVVLTRTWPSYVYLNEVGTELYLQAGELEGGHTGSGELRPYDRRGDIWNMELWGSTLCQFVS